MISTRKAVRDAIVDLLSDDTSGFNAKLDAIATDYDIAPFAINWSADSTQFVQQALDPAQVEPSKVIQFPGVALYTTFSQNTNDEKFRMFSGEVIANIDFYLDYRDGLEGQNTENVADAVEDALIQVLNDPQTNWGALGCVWAGNISCQRESIRLMEDGYSQRLPFQLTFEVHV